jgi:multidrug efflux pump subunit AcrB
MSHKTDREIIESTHNTARFFTEKRHVAWVLLIGTVLWGVFSYERMPKAKDPTIAVRVALALCTWPGASAEKIEQLVTKKIEAKIAENAKVEKIESVSRSSVAIVYITIKENIDDPAREFDDIKLKLDSIHDLPSGAGPIQFLKDFGDTAALLLTVASPKVSDIEIDLRARVLEKAIASTRQGASSTKPDAPRATLLALFPASINAEPLHRIAEVYARATNDDASSFARDARVLEGVGFIGVDLESEANDRDLVLHLRDFVSERLHLSEINPDVWHIAVVRDPEDIAARLTEVAGDKYSYRELEDFTETIQRHLQAVPSVSKVARSGVLPERIFLEYSQERMAALGVQLSSLESVIGARNITFPGGILEIHDKNLTIDPSGEIHDEDDLGDILIAASGAGLPLYLRDVVEISRGYVSPPRFLNFLTARDSTGNFARTRAITLSVQMRKGEQIESFGAAVDARLAEARRLLPDDLVVRRTSDQPLQVKESVGLFIGSLYEAIALVVIVALIGFWEWRSALLMALSIPITIAMTYGFMQLLGIDVQQISIASLILALGLLVDDPVVAGDAIKRELASGKKRIVAAWLGPTKLATAILFATITNIVAYLPFLALSGDVGRFIYSLPVVLTCSLVASRLVSMTFIPLLSYYLLRAPKKAALPMEQRRNTGFAKFYYRSVGWALDHRKFVLIASLVPLIAFFSAGRTLKESFFPKDLSYLSYVDVWLPEDAPLAATRNIVEEAEKIIIAVSEDQGKELASISTFVGGGAPRFWFSVSPEIEQLNYAQLVIQMKDKRDTRAIIAPLQTLLSKQIAGARIDVRELENGKPVGIPVSVRISGEEISELRAISEKMKSILRDIPFAERVRDDWGADSFAVKLEVDPDRANIAGITNLDVAVSSAVGMTGQTVGTLRDANRQIPIVARLRAEERAQLGDIQNLYVYSTRGPQKVPLRQVSRVAYRLETEKIRRRNQFRTITVSAFPTAGFLPSQVMKVAGPEIEKLRATLPPGYHIEIGGEQEEQQKGFGELTMVMAMSVGMIFLALVLQFQNAVKPFIVFAAIPYGIAGAIVSLATMGAPFGFMAFLGIISLVGVIVSHIIVLFDFIEEAREHGAPLREALLDAGILRLRPVLVTVGATVLGLIPLARNGGPLWEPLCYAQIGGLTIATVLTLLLVPVLYAIFVVDLKWVEWTRGDALVHSDLR